MVEGVFRPVGLGGGIRGGARRVVGWVDLGFALFGGFFHSKGHCLLSCFFFLFFLPFRIEAGYLVHMPERPTPQPNSLNPILNLIHAPNRITRSRSRLGPQRNIPSVFRSSYITCEFVKVDANALKHTSISSLCTKRKLSQIRCLLRSFFAICCAFGGPLPLLQARFSAHESRDRVATSLCHCYCPSTPSLLVLLFFHAANSCILPRCLVLTGHPLRSRT